MQLLCISLTSQYVCLCVRAVRVCVPGDQVSSLHNATGVEWLQTPTLAQPDSCLQSHRVCVCVCVCVCVYSLWECSINMILLSPFISGNYLVVTSSFLPPPSLLILLLCRHICFHSECFGTFSQAAYTQACPRAFIAWRIHIYRLGSGCVAVCCLTAPAPAGRERRNSDSHCLLQKLVTVASLHH